MGNAMALVTGANKLRSGVSTQGVAPRVTKLDELRSVHRHCTEETPGTLRGVSTMAMRRSHSAQLRLKISEMWCHCAATPGGASSDGVCECCTVLADLGVKGGAEGGGGGAYFCGERAGRCSSCSESLTDSDRDWASDGTTSDEVLDWKASMPTDGWGGGGAAKGGGATGGFDVRSEIRKGKVVGRGSDHSGIMLTGRESQARNTVHFKESGTGVLLDAEPQDEQSSNCKGPMWVKSTKVAAVESPLRGRDLLCPYTGAMPISSFSFSRNAGFRPDPNGALPPTPPHNHHHPADLFFDATSGGGGSGILANVEASAIPVHIPSREFHTAQSLAFESPELLQACRNRDSIMMERDDLDGGAQKKASAWKKMKRKLWARVTPQCLRPELPPSMLTSAGSTRTASLKRMETISQSRAQHEEDVFAAAASVKRYTRRQRYLVDKIEQSIV